MSDGLEAKEEKGSTCSICQEPLNDAQLPSKPAAPEGKALASESCSELSCFDEKDKSVCAVNPCLHRYHVGCLKQWYVSGRTGGRMSCPLCRGAVVSLWKITNAGWDPVSLSPSEDTSTDDDSEDESTSTDDDYSIYSEDEVTSIDDDHHICSKCGRGDRERDLLLCDGFEERCPNAAHYDCIGLDRIPSGPWFCASCREIQIQLARSIAGKSNPPARNNAVEFESNAKMFAVKDAEFECNRTSVGESSMFSSREGPIFSMGRLKSHVRSVPDSFQTARPPPEQKLSQDQESNTRLRRPRKRTGLSAKKNDKDQSLNCPSLKRERISPPLPDEYVTREAMQHALAFLKSLIRAAQKDVLLLYEGREMERKRGLLSVCRFAFTEGSLPTYNEVPRRPDMIREAILRQGALHILWMWITPVVQNLKKRRKRYYPEEIVVRTVLQVLLVLELRPLHMYWTQNAMKNNAETDHCRIRSWPKNVLFKCLPLIHFPSWSWDERCSDLHDAVSFYASDQSPLKSLQSMARQVCARWSTEKAGEANSSSRGSRRGRNALESDQPRGSKNECSRPDYQKKRQKTDSKSSAISKKNVSSLSSSSTPSRQTGSAEILDAMFCMFREKTNCAKDPKTPMLEKSVRRRQQQPTKTQRSSQSLLVSSNKLAQVQKKHSSTGTIDSPSPGRVHDDISNEESNCVQSLSSSSSAVELLKGKRDSLLTSSSVSSMEVVSSANQLEEEFRGTCENLAPPTILEVQNTIDTIFSKQEKTDIKFLISKLGRDVLRPLSKSKVVSKEDYKRILRCATQMEFESFAMRVLRYPKIRPTSMTELFHQNFSTHREGIKRKIEQALGR